MTPRIPASAGRSSGVGVQDHQLHSLKLVTGDSLAWTKTLFHAPVLIHFWNKAGGYIAGELVALACSVSGVWFPSVPQFVCCAPFWSCSLSCSFTVLPSPSEHFLTCLLLLTCSLIWTDLHFVAWLTDSPSPPPTLSLTCGVEVHTSDLTHGRSAKLYPQPSDTHMHWVISLALLHDSVLNLPSCLPPVKARIASCVWLFP